MTKSKTATTEKQTATQIEIPQPEEQMLRIVVKGLSSLVVNKNHFVVSGSIPGKGAKTKIDRNPEREFHDSIHWIDESKGLSGFPSRGFKASCVTAGQILKIKDYQKARVRASFFIPGDLVPLDGTPKFRQDVVRLRGTTPDNRYRAEYWPWGATIELIFADSILNIEQIMQLFTVAGARVGVGEDRPEKGGSWGRFKIESAELFQAK